GIPIEESGVADGFLQWIRLEFAEDIIYENIPPEWSVWAQLIHVFPEGIPVKAGDVFKIVVSHDRRNIGIWAA
ncbi:MAG: hypothetical protein MUC31_07525, partial [Bacteroidales bacterium]|nr:hypothetical protein [Bacteroidales bacterium]